VVVHTQRCIFGGPAIRRLSTSQDGYSCPRSIPDIVPKRLYAFDLPPPGAVVATMYRFRDVEKTSFDASSNKNLAK
jgi:hypothetical protein